MERDVMMLMKECVFVLDYCFHTHLLLVVKFNTHHHNITASRMTTTRHDIVTGVEGD
jgi:hypothetical protein